MNKNEKILKEQEKKIESQKVKINQLKQKVDGFERETFDQFVSLLIYSFGFVAALFWRDAIQTSLNHFFSVSELQANYWIIQLGIAIAVTAFAAFTIFFLNRMKSRKD